MFGPVDHTLKPGAKNAVETCLNVQAGEGVALVFDERSGGVAASLAAALEARRACWTGYAIESFAPRPMSAAPPQILDALEHADAAILCMQPQEGELAARMAIVDVIERRRIRYAHMIGVTPTIMRQGMRADYHMVDRLSQRLCERMPAARTLRVTSAGGTAFTASFDPGYAWVKTSGLISPRYWSNLPAGEVFTTPASVDGTFVCDATAGDYFNAKYGDLRATPLVLELEGGRLVSARCARADLERDFWRYCHTDDQSDRVGELAFGTNVGLSAMIGVLLQDEKVPGVHIALGDPYGRQTHAPWKSRTHVDVLTRQCDVWIDDEPVMTRGRFHFDRLGLERRARRRSSAA